MRIVLAATAAVLALAVGLGMLLLWPRGRPDVDLREIGVARDIFEAEVVRSSTGPCPGTEAEQEIACIAVEATLTEGPDAGRVVEFGFSPSPATPDLGPGDNVVLAFDPEADEGFRYSFLDRQRRPALLWLALLFALTVVVLGGLRGFAALAGLAGSLIVLLVFVLPAVLEGKSPVLVAVVGAGAIAFLALYLAHGPTLMTTVALLGTLVSLGLTAVLAEVFIDFARISGFATEEAIIVTVGAAQIDLAGLVLGGVVIGALGAIDDMTVTQASAIWELNAANPRLTPRRLFRSGLRVGKDHVASTVNTLVLAYAGASMPLLILFVLSNQSLGSVANSETIATEIIRTLVGSIGLVASVPITTWLAAHVVGAPSARADAEEG